MTGPWTAATAAAERAGRDASDASVLYVHAIMHHEAKPFRSDWAERLDTAAACLAAAAQPQPAPAGVP